MHSVKSRRLVERPGKTDSGKVLMLLLLSQRDYTKHMALALKGTDTLSRERSRKDSQISHLWKGQVNLINIVGLKSLMVSASTLGHP